MDVIWEDTVKEKSNTTKEKIPAIAGLIAIVVVTLVVVIVCHELGIDLSKIAAH